MKKIFCLLVVCALLVSCNQQPSETAATAMPETPAGNGQEAATGEMAFEQSGLIDVATSFNFLIT
jgi:hypothetical protein